MKREDLFLMLVAAMAIMYFGMEILTGGKLIVMPVSIANSLIVPFSKGTSVIFLGLLGLSGVIHGCFGRLMKPAAILILLIVAAPVMADESIIRPPLREGVDVYRGPLLAVGTPVWSNVSDGIYHECATDRGPERRLSWAPRISRECFRHEGVSHFNHFVKATITGYNVDPRFDQPTGYRVTFTFPNGETMDRWTVCWADRSQLIYQVINVDDERTAYSRIVILLNW